MAMFNPLHPASSIFLIIQINRKLTMAVPRSLLLVQKISRPTINIDIGCIIISMNIRVCSAENMKPTRENNS